MPTQIGCSSSSCRSLSAATFFKFRHCIPNTVITDTPMATVEATLVADTASAKDSRRPWRMVGELAAKACRPKGPASRTACGETEMSCFWTSANRVVRRRLEPIPTPTPLEERSQILYEHPPRGEGRGGEGARGTIGDKERIEERCVPSSQGSKSGDS